MMQRVREGCRPIFVAGCAVANLPSRQVVPRGAVKAGMPGASFGRVPMEIIFDQIRPRCRGKRRSRAWRGLWWWMSRRARSPAATTLQQNCNLNLPIPTQASWHHAFGQLSKLKATNALAWSYTTLSLPFLLLPLSSTRYMIHYANLREFTTLYILSHAYRSTYIDASTRPASASQPDVIPF